MQGPGPPAHVSRQRLCQEVENRTNAGHDRPGAGGRRLADRVGPSIIDSAAVRLIPPIPRFSF